MTWLQQYTDTATVLHKVRDIVSVTRSTGEANFHSASLERALQLGRAVWALQPLPSEGLLLGALLANREELNAFGALLVSASGGRDLLDLLLTSLPWARDRLGHLPPQGAATFSFSWDPSPLGSSHPLPSLAPLQLPLAHAAVAAAPPCRDTHWVVTGRILCGRSPGVMEDTQLLDIVTAGRCEMHTTKY